MTLAGPLRTLAGPPTRDSAGELAGGWSEATLGGTTSEGAGDWAAGGAAESAADELRGAAESARDELRADRGEARVGVEATEPLRPRRLGVRAGDGMVEAVIGGGHDGTCGKMEFAQVIGG